MFNFQLKSYLHLRLQPVVVLTTDIIATQTAGVLQLHTALFVEPVLQADSQVSLIPTIYLGIAVEGFAAGYDVECINYRYAGCYVTTTATHLTILSA